MNKKSLSILLSSCILTNLCSIPVSADNFQVVNDQDMNPTNSTWGNDYETTNEFTISSAEDLFAFAAMVNSGKDFKGKTILLNQSITLTAENWIPIGTADIYDDRNIPNFAGTFDGQNNSISNLKLSYAIEENDPLYNYGGLFGYVTGTIKNLNLVDTNLKAASRDFGGIAGFLGEGGTIENCTTSGTISGATYDGRLYGSKVGGIVGESKGNITSCINKCTIVNTEYNVGGIVGWMNRGNISDCENTGSIEGYGYTGGIVGKMKGNDRTNDEGTVNKNKISNCSNSGEIIGKDKESIDNRSIGGIVGDTTTVEIINCHNTGTVSASKVNEVGGVVGMLYYGGKVEGCSNSGIVTGDIKAGGIVGYACSCSQKGYEVKNCQNKGAVSGSSNVGGVVGTSSSADEKDLVLDVSNCTNSGSVIGTTNVGGIIGNHNSSEGIGVGAAAASVSGCINTGSIPQGAGAIVGQNNSENDHNGKVENNFWPAELGNSAVGSGVGSSSESTDSVKNNSSYKPDGSLTTPISEPDGSGSSISNLGDAIEQIIGGSGTGTNVPEALKVTVTYNSNGHGTNPNPQTVTIGKSITLPQMINVGYYTFTGWSDGSKTYKAGDEVIVMKDIQFTAQWRNDTPSGGGGGGGSSTTGTQKVKNAVYRAYNPNSGEHFYTPHYDEFKFITKLGWDDEGIACMTETQNAGHTLYRLYNPNSGLHHYTLDENERNVLVSLGWNDEGVAWYTSKNTNDPAVYRLYNQNDGQHHYTMDVKERDALVKLGWDDEGIGYRSTSIKK